ncbi:MAG: hypothetical protein ACM3TN_28165 [Alphaproteobacteria bacterium]
MSHIVLPRIGVQDRSGISAGVSRLLKVVLEDGQSTFTRAFRRATRRLDLDTHWTKEFSHLSTKEALIPQKNDERETAPKKWCRGCVGRP